MNVRIKQIRHELGLTQTEFAERIGLKQNSIALIESGKRNISDQAVLSICREYGINEEWLRTGHGEKMSPDATNELDALAKKYNLDHKGYVLIEKLCKNEKVRDQLADFCIEYAKDLLYGNGDGDVPSMGSEKNGDPFPDIPKTPEELERRYPPVRPDTKKSS